MVNYRNVFWALLVAGLSGLTSCSSTIDTDDIIVEECEIVVEKPTGEHKKDNKELLSKVAAPAQSGAVGKLPAVAAKGASVSATKAFTPKRPGISVSSVSVKDPYVALTFDDGPHPSLTPELLDVLKKYNVRATFFVLGSNVNRYPQIVARAASEGHEIANHSYSHPILAKQGQAKLQSEMEMTANAIEKACGQRPRVMRPPYGSLTTAQRQFVYDQYGYHVIMWNVDTLDWKKPGASVVAQRFINGAKPGSIMLGHDIHAGTIASMEETLRTLTQRGVRFVTVSELIEAGKSAAAGVAQQ